jgi:hypothetical protein
MMELFKATHDLGKNTNVSQEDDVCINNKSMRGEKNG